MYVFRLQSILATLQNTKTTNFPNRLYTESAIKALLWVVPPRMARYREEPISAKKVRGTRQNIPSWLRFSTV